MSDPPATRLAAAAEGLVGTRFRLHGRSPETGLDCVGLVAAALARCGRQPLAPAGYRLRMTDPGPWLSFAEANGFLPVPAAAPVKRGDLLLVHLRRLQPHLLIALGSATFVHAHAGLGRVVRQPGPPPGPVAAHWRLDEKG